MKKKVKKLLTALIVNLILGGLSVMTVSASEEQPKTEVPETYIWEPEVEAPLIEMYATASDYLPELKSGNYEKWIDRAKFPDYAVNFYNVLIEASDNDGKQDFLIDENCSKVEHIQIWENGSAGTRTQVAATGVKIMSITGDGSTWDEAYADINDQYYQKYYMLRTAFEAFDRDFSEVFWLSGSFYLVVPEYRYYSQWNQSKNAYDYYYTGDMYLILASPIFDIQSINYPSAAVIRTAIQKLNANIDAILAGAAGKNEQEKIKYFNNWLTMNNEYNYRIGYNHENVTNVLKTYPDAFECTAALEGLTGNYGPVCESYARAMKVLCDRSGIPCVLVDGYAINTVNGTGENHMWNYIKLDGAWYGVDVTWNDPLAGNAGAVSGRENETYMLLGGHNYTEVGGGSMRFLDSHPVKNRHFTDSIQFINGPMISVDRYVPTMKGISLSANVTSVAYGYTELPVLTAWAEKLDGQTGEITYTWYEVDANGNERWLVEESSNVMVFPEGLTSGTHTIRAKASLGRCVKSADVQITVIRTEFSDVTEKDYFYNPVIWAVLNGVTAGYYQDKFAPYMNCTRGQVVTFLWRANGCPQPQTTENPFWDVKVGDYYYKAVLWAAENGITAGYYQNDFAPDVTITRAQFATFLYRAEGKPAYSVENPFSDIEEGRYYYDAVLWAVENGITAGYYQDLFAPDIGCTRGQVVSFLYRNR